MGRKVTSIFCRFRVRWKSCEPCAALAYLIILSARHMKTCEGNVRKVIARQGATTLEWLARHGVEYDEIHFGKPFADIYIDDNSLRFESWESISDDGSSLPSSNESRL